MHFEAPEQVAQSLKEFLGHYLMIVVSILSALGAEQVVDYAYNVHKAHVFKGQIEIELKRNKAMVDGAMTENLSTLAYWNSLLKRTHVLDPGCGAEVGPEYQGILKDAVNNYHENTPILQSSGWESAVAVGSVVYFDPTDVQRYSNSYSMQRFYASAMDRSLRGGITNMSDLGALVYERRPDCAAVARLVNARVRMLSVLGSNLDELRDELVK
jgi:hypothetical protein